MSEEASVQYRQEVAAKMLGAGASYRAPEMTVDDIMFENVNEWYKLKPTASRAELVLHMKAFGFVNAASKLEGMCIDCTCVLLG